MPGSRDTSPNRDTREHHNDLTRQQQQRDITDFERYRRQLTETIQNNKEWIMRALGSTAGLASSQLLRGFTGIEMSPESSSLANIAAATVGAAVGEYLLERLDNQIRSGINSARELKRTEAPLETILETEAWKSPLVQKSLTQLGKEIPGTQKWNDQAADVIFEYQEAMRKVEETENNIIAKLDTLSKMLGPGGIIYEQRKREN